MRLWFRFLASLLAFGWGLAFALVFRFSLNQTYPFWSQNISISLYANLLGLGVLISFWRYFHLHHINRKRRLWYLIGLWINSILFLIAIFSLGNERYLYWYPIFYIAQILILLYFLAAKLPFFLPYRLPLILGILPAQLPILQDRPIFTVLISLFVASWPNRLLRHHHIVITNHSAIRMIPLRSALDLAKIASLGLSLFAIFDTFRSYFYPVISLIILGFATQIIIAKNTSPRRHLRFGIILLTFGFFVLGISSLMLPLPIWTSLLFIFVSLWEAIYFKRSVEGYLSRERTIAAFVALFIIGMHFVQIPWVKLIAATLILGCLLRMITYLYKSYRILIALSFSTAVLSWGTATGVHFGEASKFSFVKEKRKEELPLLSLQEIQAISKNNELISNISLHLKDSPQKSKITIHPTFLTTYIALEDFHKNQVFLYYPMGAYQKKSHLLLEYSKILGLENFRIAQGANFLADEKTIEALKKSNYKSISKSTGKTMEEAGFLDQAEFIYSEALKIFPKSTQLLRAQAMLAGRRGKIVQQLKFIDEYFKICRCQEPELQRLAMQLEASQGNLKSSRERAYMLLRNDKKGALEYFQWLLNLELESPNRYDLEKLRVQVVRWKVPKNQEREKADLLRKISGAIEENLAWHERHQEELHRQEELKFPE